MDRTCRWRSGCCRVVLLLGTALLACLLPARRASQLDPVEALRE